MKDCISRNKAIEELYLCYDNEYPTANGDFDEYALHDVPNTLKLIPDVEIITANKRKEMIDYFYDMNVRADIKIEALVDDIISMIEV